MMIYCITAIYEKKGIFKSEKSHRTFGYYLNLDDAFQAVKENLCNMHECLYNYLVIEGMLDGVHSWCQEEYWFKWEDNHWERLCSKPEFFNGICNWSMG